MRRGTEPAIKMGLYLKELREQKGLSMNELGRRMGVPAATVSQTEKAERALKSYRIQMWANGLGVTYSTINDVYVELDEVSVGPIQRRRTRSIETGSLWHLISELSGPERERVRGYIEGIMEGRH